MDKNRAWFCVDVRGVIGPSLFFGFEVGVGFEFQTVCRARGKSKCALRRSMKMREKGRDGPIELGSADTKLLLTKKAGTVAGTRPNKYQTASR